MGVYHVRTKLASGSLPEVKNLATVVHGCGEFSTRMVKLLDCSDPDYVMKRSMHQDDIPETEAEFSRMGVEPFRDVVLFQDTVLGNRTGSNEVYTLGWFFLLDQNPPKFPEEPPIDLS